MLPKETECPLLLQDHTKISWHRHDGTTEPERSSGAGELDGSMLSSVMSQMKWEMVGDFRLCEQLARVREQAELR